MGADQANKNMIRITWAKTCNPYHFFVNRPNFYVQSNLLNTYTKGTDQSVHIIEVSTLYR